MWSMITSVYFVKCRLDAVLIICNGCPCRKVYQQESDHNCDAYSAYFIALLGCHQESDNCDACSAYFIALLGKLAIF